VDGWKRDLVEALHDVDSLPRDCLAEHRLYRKVLEQALFDYWRCRGGEQSEFKKDVWAAYKDAGDWIFSRVEPASLEGRVMSFRNVCLLLGVPPHKVRRLAQEVTHEEAAGWKQAKASVGKSEEAEKCRSD
jgi:hypothetical protein